jgi:NADPH:quinone reductase-like Zn-dependent oxidoreductase
MYSRKTKAVDNGHIRSSAMYELVVKGRLESDCRLFDEYSVLVCPAREESRIRVCLPDQAAMFGLLRLIRDSGITLLALNALQDDQALVRPDRVKETIADAHLNDTPPRKSSTQEGNLNMKAAIATKYGSPDVVSLTQVETPVPKEDQLLVKTIATTVSAGDWRIRSLEVPAGYGLLMRMFFGFLRPRIQILGTELVGEVVSVGAAASRFRPGDLVVGYPGVKLKCHAEYRLFQESDSLIAKPKCLTMEEAAAMSFGGMAAYDFLVNKGKLKAGMSVLIIGASGSVGSASVQIAKHLGAQVSAICSQRNADWVQALGADRVIPYDRLDNQLSHGLSQQGSSEKYDLILDMVGECSLTRLGEQLKPSGKALLGVASLCREIWAPIYSAMTSKRIESGASSERQKDLESLAHLVEQGGYRPVVDRVLTLDQIVEAHRYVDTGRKKGNLVIRF